MKSEKITINDMTGLFCVAGIRRAFERAGMDLQKFIEDGGATEDELRGHGCDAMLNKVIDRKSKARADG